MDWKLELVAVPVTDVDRAKAFYVEQAGFNADHDHTVSDEIRFVQLTPPGSACSIAIGRGVTDAEPGSVARPATRRRRCRRGARGARRARGRGGRGAGRSRGAASCSSPTPTATAGRCRRLVPAVGSRAWRTCSPPTFADVLAARKRIAPYLRPTPLFPYEALERARRHRGLGQAREPPAGRRVQGARRRQPGRAALAGGAGARRDRGLDRQPRAVGRLRRAPLRRAGDRVRARVARTRSRSRRCAGSAPRSSSTGATSTWRASTPPALAAEHGYRYIHSGNEPDLIAGVATGTLELLEDEPCDRGDRRPDRRRQRGGRRLHRGQGREPGHRGHRRAVRGGAGGLPHVEGRPARRGSHGDVRRGPRHARAVRAAAADHARAPRRLRPRLRRRDPRGDGRA